MAATTGDGSIPAQMQARQGRWSVVGIDDSHFILRLIEQGSGPIDVKVHILDQNTWQNRENLKHPAPPAELTGRPEIEAAAGPVAWDENWLGN